MTQPMPTPGQEAVFPALIAEIEARNAKGRETYGRDLETFNGRDALEDAFEECLDQLVYLKQARMERDALRRALTAMLDFTEGMDGEVYGPFMGGDPRRFEPDPEVCSLEEIGRWEEACAEWEAGRGEDRGPGCATMGDGSAWDGKGLGVGTTTIVIPEIELARAVLGLHEREGEDDAR